MWICFSGQKAFRSWTDVFPYKSVGFLIAAIAAMRLLSSHLKATIRENVIQYARGASGSAIVSVNGQATPNAPVILLELAKITSLPAHHSSPTTKLRVKIRDGEKSLVLDLGRDSGDSREYWVFYPGLPSTSYGESEIGRLRTNTFDMYRDSPREDCAIALLPVLPNHSHSLIPP